MSLCLTAALVCGPAAAPSSAAAAAKPASAKTAAASPTAALPESVVVRLPYKDLSILDVQLQWYRQAQRYRPGGSGLERKRAFVGQLVEKEMLAHAATAEPFTATEQESARFLTDRARLLGQTLFQRLVIDSLSLEPGDWDAARAAVSGGMPDSNGIADTTGLSQLALRSAMQRRDSLVSERLRADLAPVWDDSVAALMAREFAKLPPLQQRRGSDVAMRVTNRVPTFAPADTGRVLVAAKGDRITVGAFLVRFQGIPPTEREYPVTIGEVKARAEQFLGAAWFLRESLRRGLDRDPAVVSALAEKREGFALDHWYQRHVLASVDTSESAVRAFYDKDPKPYAISAHRLVKSAVFQDSLAADSLRRSLAKGERWEDWCGRRYSDTSAREGCAFARPVYDVDADTAYVQMLAARKPGDTWVRRIGRMGGYAFETGQLSERIEGRLRTYPEARTYVVRSLIAEQLEKRLQALIAEMKASTPVRWNEEALARLDLGPERPGSP